MRLGLGGSATGLCTVREMRVILLLGILNSGSHGEMRL